MIISGNDVVGAKELKGYLMSHFKIKDKGNLTYFLGVEVSRTKKGIGIRQRKNAEDLLLLVYLTNTKFIDAPVELHERIRRDGGSPLSDPTLYHRLGGSLFYLTMTQLNITHAV